MDKKILEKIRLKVEIVKERTDCYCDRHLCDSCMYKEHTRYCEIPAKIDTIYYTLLETERRLDG